MGWGAAIITLLQIFGPFVADLLKQLLDRWLNKAAALLPEPGTFGSDAERDVALLEKTLEIMPRWMVLRRRAVERMLPVAKSRVLDPETAGELAELGVAGTGGLAA